MKKKIDACLLILIGFIIIISVSCKKEDNNYQPPEEAGPVVLKENVYVVDTALILIDIAASDLVNGIYIFNCSGTPPDLKVNDIIVGSQGDGFIRKIKSITQNGSQITMQTTQGTMEDVFQSGEFNFNIDLSGMGSGKTSGFSHTETNKMIYQNGPLSIELLNGSISLDPNWFFDFKFSLNSGLTKFEMSTNNTSYSASAEVKVTASQAVTLIDRTDTLARYTKLIKKWVMVGYIPVPVIFRINVYWLADFSADIDAAVSSTVNFTSSSPSLNLGLKYIENQWEGIYNLNTSSNLSVTPPSGQVGLTVNYSWRPIVEVRLYGIAGPYASVGLMTKLTGTLASPSLDWDINTQAWVKSSIGLNFDLDVNLDTLHILGLSSISLHSNQNKIWETEKLTYQTPYSIESILGNNQSASTGSPLPNPIKVRILDSKGLPQKNAKVNFTITSGGGNVSSASELTDQNGYAQTIWTIGTDLGVQKVTVSAKNGSSINLQNSPITFTATNTSLCDGSLSLSLSRNGKRVTANTIGGVPPYQYSFFGKAYINLNYSDLSHDGAYYVVVKDANSCTDTVKDCINDVTVDSVKISDWNGAVKLLRISYHTPLGLIPDFAYYDQANDDYPMILLTVTGGNSADYALSTDICDNNCNEVFPGIRSFSYTGPVTNRMIACKLSGGNTTPTIIKFRFYKSCTGWQCSSLCTSYHWSNEYTIGW